MYNIFNVKSKRIHEPDKELEPPTKKLITEGDIVIKSLSEKQLNTKTTLSEQLQHTKQFVKGVEYIPLADRLIGTHSLSELQSEAVKFDSIDKLRLLGLNTNDIQLLEDLKSGFNYVKNKYRNVNETVLLDDIQRISQIVNDSQNKVSQCYSDSNMPIAKQDAEALFSVKPNSSETKLLKFVLQNQERSTALPHPMDEIKTIETNFEKDLKLFAPVDTKQIRKKARSLHNQIKHLENSTVQESVQKLKNVASHSKWDQKEADLSTKKVKDCKEKTYTCKKPNYYTIKDGQIIQLNKSPESQTTSKKLTVDELRQLEKFKNYDPGKPSSKLFLKNLHKNIGAPDLYSLLSNLDKSRILSIDVMKGKLKGQAFIQFCDQETAVQALETINGSILKNKPIVASFGKTMVKETNL